MTLTVGSLFSGIGGLERGLELTGGFETRWQCEHDDYCSRVLAKHWPAVPNLGDVTKVDWEHVERVDLICGGYPCQPFSYAGARRGEDDERHLWPYMRDALRVLRPRFALLENVPGHLSLGFGRVLGDLAECGYDAEWDCVPAAAVGAPHLRYRVFVVAYTRRVGSEPRGIARVLGESPRAREGKAPERQRVWDAARDSGEVRPDSDGGRLEERAQLDREPEQRAADGSTRGRHADGLRHALADAHGAPSASAFGAERGAWAAPTRPRDARPRGRDSSSRQERGWWTVEPDVGRVAYGVPRRVDRLRSLGNAVVPQVAEWIGRRILESERVA